MPLVWRSVARRGQRCIRRPADGAGARCPAQAPPDPLLGQCRPAAWFHFKGRRSGLCRRGRAGRSSTPVPADRRRDGEPAPTGGHHDGPHRRDIRVVAGRRDRIAEHGHPGCPRGNPTEQSRVSSMAGHALSPRHVQRSRQIGAARQRLLRPTELDHGHRCSCPLSMRSLGPAQVSSR